MASFAPPPVTADPAPATRVRARLLGHQGRCFDVRASAVDPNLIVSASEDGTGKLWDLAKRKCLFTMTHNTASEVLRSVFMGHHACLAGSDGSISVWNVQEQAAARSSHTPIHRFKHATEYSQVYVCEPSPHCVTELLSGADNRIYLWDLHHEQERFSFELEPIASKKEAFGGARNASGEVFVFDAKWCPSVPYVIAAAASDATVRMLDFRTVQGSSSAAHAPAPNGAAALVLDLSDGNLGHATSVNWGEGDCSHLVSVSFGSGCVALFDLRKGADCLAIQRAHAGACYGALFHSQPSVPRALCSFSSDASIKLWDYSTLLVPEEGAAGQEPALELRSQTQLTELSEVLTCCPVQGSALLCGGASANAQNKGMGAFLGTPILLLEPHVE